MAYVGNQPARGQFRKLTDISGSFNGVTTTFTTSVPPGTTSYYVTAGTASQLLVSLGGVIQQPEVDYTVSTNSITFTTAPAAGLSFFGVLMGDALNSGTPGDGTVTTTKLAGNLNVGLAGGSAASPSLYFTGDTNNGIYSPGADTLAISTNGAQRVTVNSSGNVGMGSTSPGVKLDVVSDNNTSLASIIRANSNNLAANLSLAYDGLTGNSAIQIQTTNANPITFRINNSEAGRFDTSGRFLVGTSTARSNFFNQASTFAPQMQIEGVGSAGQAMLSITSGDSTFGPYLNLARQKSGAVGGNTAVSNNDVLGNITFQGSDGTEFVAGAEISAVVDGTPGANDMPGRLVFSVTRDGSASPTEAARINNAGYSKFTNTGGYIEGGTFSYHEFYRSGSGLGLVVTGVDASYASVVNYIQCSRAASNAYSLLSAYSSSGVDREFNLQGDGNGYCDLAWIGGGADYAEYFEWSDNNPNEEDRRGISVVLDGDKIRQAVAGEDPIGVISGNPSVVGDAAWNKWTGKYLRDEFGTYIQEDYEVEDEDGNTVVQQRRKLNPAYDPDVEYIPREQRPEWDCVGLMGKLRIRKGQVTGSHWIKMRDINDSVEEWLVR